ncbi:AAA family ATPase [Streptomyces sp. NK08204]|uniref:caspase, EACC1-associated type n=1 Tax=Streptomyces sp. NK08204 TaxID=2873260 RepID=UPI001CEDBB9B|nr:AAA family ATPase [Streptomyces sp. NK08204]
MSDLSGAGARVLLLATARHDGPTLPPVPSAATTLDALRTALIERCGVPPSHIRAELDPPDARSMAQAVAEEAQRADTVLLVHFVGHGLLDQDGELYLAARSTDRLDPGLAGHQALSFSALRQALAASRASSVVLLLDCCFSGRPALGRGLSVPAFSMDPTPGLYFIGSAEQLALAPPDATRTAFTGALIDVLTHGDPRGPHQLTLDLVYDAVFRTMRDRQLPLPRRQAEGRTGSLVVASNPAVPAQTEPAEAAEPAPGRCPYPGLSSFGPEDARLFCGRERMLERVLTALEESAGTPAGAGPWVLIGPSGSGKTSLLNAGLLHRLRENGLAGSAGWPVLRLTPGASPLRRLAALLDVPAEEARELLRTAPERATDLVDRLLADRPGQRLIVLVDQLEEVFTLCRSDEERTAFLRALTVIATPAKATSATPPGLPSPSPSPSPSTPPEPPEPPEPPAGPLSATPPAGPSAAAPRTEPSAVTPPAEPVALTTLPAEPAPVTASDGSPPRALVVLALRADFYGRATSEPDLLAALRDRPLLVEPMRAEELRAAIEEPAVRTGLELDDGLADLMLHEFGAMNGGQPAAGALPLLSHALLTTWKHRAGSRLTFAGYRKTGGIAEAVANTAEEVYETLDPDGRQAVKHLLTRLVRVGSDSPDTAQPVERPTLLHGLPDAAARQALERLTEARLLTLDQDTVRISHEALIRAWPRLREWVDADREWLRARQQLADDARSWEQSGQDPSLLYRGNRLAGVRDRAAGASAGTRDLEPRPAAFLEASVRRQRRSVRRTRFAVIVLAVLFLAASVGLAGSVVFQRRAERARQHELARYLAAEAEDLRDRQPDLAKQLSLLSFQIDHEAGRGALLNSQRTPGLINDGHPAHDLATSADGSVLAISTGDSIVLRTRGGSHRIGATAGPIAVSRDGKTLITATYGSGRSTITTVRLWDVSRPARPRQTAALRTDHPVTSLAAGADGSTVFAGLANGDVRLWDIRDRAAPAALPTLHGHSRQVDSLAVSPRRGLLASMSVDGRILLWNVSDVRHPGRAATLAGAPFTDSGDHNPLHRVAFDRTGRLLAAPMPVKSNSDLGLWRVDAPGTPQRIHRDGESDEFASGSCFENMTSLTFSPARDHVVGTCGDKWQAWVYAADTKPALLVPGTSIGLGSAAVTSSMVLFDPGRSRRLLQATDRGVFVWYLSNAAQPGADDFLALEPGTGGQLAFAASGRKELIAWQGAGRNYLAALSGPGKKKLLAITHSPNMLTGEDIELSRDGRLLADVEVFGRKNGKPQYVGVMLRDTAHPTGAPLATIGDELNNGVSALAFSPTEPLLAVSDMNGWIASNHTKPVVRLFDISNPRRPRQVSRIPVTAMSLAFSPDGRTLLTDDSPLKKPKGSRPSTAMRLKSWDVTRPAHPAELWSRRLSVDVSSVYLAFRPDGKVLAAYQGNGTLRLWRLRGNRPAGPPAEVRISEYGGSVAFSPDGNRLALLATNISSASAGTGGFADGQRVEIWNVSDPRDPTRESYLPTSDVATLYSLAFSPDGRRLAVTRMNAGVDLWDISPRPVISDLCNSVGDPITRRQWKHYLPDRPYAPPCR